MSRPGDPVEPTELSEPGAALLDAVAVIDRLRSPDGCPWYAEQTHASLAPYAIEEAHEVADAAEAGDGAALVDELGDLLLQVLIHARIAQEEAGAGRFDIDDVARTLVAKMVRRNPHVFGDARADTVDEVHELYDAVKAAEHRRAHVLDGLPVSLPALVRAQKVASRLRKAGEPPSMTEATADAGPAERIGADLLALVIEADAAGVDAEASLRAATRRLEAEHRD